MFSIAIYSNNKNDINDIKGKIQDFLIKEKVMAKVFVFDDPETFITVPASFDLYVMDMDMQENITALGEKMSNIDDGAHFIYISKDISRAYEASKVTCDYFLKKPIKKEELFKNLSKIRQKVKDDTIVIQLSHGERRVRANHLNYINIVKRCLCYHLKDGTVFDGQTLRGSFEKAISPLQHHRSKSLLFLPPSLLINVGEIKILNMDNAVFENDEVLYFPRKAHDTVREAWANYNRFINEQED